MPKTLYELYRPGPKGVERWEGTFADDRREGAQETVRSRPDGRTGGLGAEVRPPKAVSGIQRTSAKR